MAEERAGMKMAAQIENPSCGSISEGVDKTAKLRNWVDTALWLVDEQAPGECRMDASSEHEANDIDEPTPAQSGEPVTKGE